jgi:F-box protein 21
MRENGIIAARDIDYYAIENSFIHLALQGRGSLPITLAIIFTGVARRCDLQAAPINYAYTITEIFLTLVQPDHVFVAVSSSLDFTMEQTFFLDVFNGGTVFTYEELSDPLSQGELLLRGTLRPAGVGAMMSRVARNIVNSINRRPTKGLELPWFAALSALTILEPDYYLYGRLCDFIRTTPSLCDTDIDIIEQACMNPLVDQHDDHMEFCRLARYYDKVGRPPKSRGSEDHSVQFKVGQIFKHRLFQFNASKDLC